MNIRTQALTGPALDWVVLLCEAWVNDCRSERFLQIFKHQNSTGQGYCYSRDWSQGGPIIEREGIAVMIDPGAGWCAWESTEGYRSEENSVYGDTPLIAAMRCYVASKLGDEVDVPDELIN